MAVKDVTWIAPEAVRKVRRDEAVQKHSGSALTDALDAIERDVVGEYREVKGYPVIGDKDDPSQPSLQRAELGGLVVWVDEAPDDPDDGSGHFETYEAKKHGSPYHPIPSRRPGATEEASDE